jgi:hydroxymethylbilane synthase
VTDRVRIGTRGSPLALAQTATVVSALRSHARRTQFDVVSITTSGDRRKAASPDFTDAIDRALRRGAIDIGVHSAKDLPVRWDDRLRLAACPRREDPRDALSQARRELPRGARIGSSSPRRRAQLLRWRSDLEVVPVRGNVDTRLALARPGRLDAVILAVAGLRRLGRADAISRILPTTRFLPAPAQAALALVTRSEDANTARLARSIDHGATSQAVHIEREFAGTMGGDCQLPLAALARVDRGRTTLTGEVLSEDGRRGLSGTVTRRRVPWTGLGRELAESFLDRGGAELLRAGA